MSEMKRFDQTVEELGSVVEHWFFEAFHGSVIARSTEAWNCVHAAKEELKQRLAVTLGQMMPDQQN